MIMPFHGTRHVIRLLGRRVTGRECFRVHSIGLRTGSLTPFHAAAKAHLITFLNRGFYTLSTLSRPSTASNPGGIRA